MCARIVALREDVDKFYEGSILLLHLPLVEVTLTDVYIDSLQFDGFEQHWLG